MEHVATAARTTAAFTERRAADSVFRGLVYQTQNPKPYIVVKCVGFMSDLCCLFPFACCKVSRRNSSGSSTVSPRSSQNTNKVEKKRSLAVASLEFVDFDVTDPRVHTPYEA